MNKNKMIENEWEKCKKVVNDKIDEMLKNKIPLNEIKKEIKKLQFETTEKCRNIIKA